MPVNHFDVGLELTTDLGRHTGGIETRDSKRAVANGNLRHGGPLIKNRDRADVAPSLFASFL